MTGTKWVGANMPFQKPPLRIKLLRCDFQQISKVNTVDQSFKCTIFLQFRITGGKRHDELWKGQCDSVVCGVPPDQNSPEP